MADATERFADFLPFNFGETVIDKVVTDGDALGALNQSLIAYTSQVEQARANNRQALPIGAQYLKSASADLRADALPLLTNLGEANDARVTEGAIVYRGERIENHAPHRVTRLGVALVPERSKVFENLTVAENLEAVVPRRGADRRQLMKQYVENHDATGKLAERIWQSAYSEVGTISVFTDNGLSGRDGGGR